jgi:hypothetical protein
MVRLSTISMLIGALLVAAGIVPVHAAEPQLIEKNNECMEAVGAAELAQKMPAGLLRGLALAETGRWDEGRQAVSAWPWTVSSFEGTRFLPTRAAAAAEIARLRGANASMIAVGCLQVDLVRHPDAFPDAERALDPVANAAYGARVMRDHYQTRGSWRLAIAHLPGGELPDELYLARVERAWATEQRRAFEQHRSRVLEAYAARKAELDRQREAAKALKPPPAAARSPKT